MNKQEHEERQRQAAAAVLKDLQAGDQALTMQQARPLLAHNTVKRPAIETVWRWRTSGARAVDGQRVILETAKLPGQWVTTDSAIRRFFARLNSIEGIVRPVVDLDEVERAAEKRLADAGL